MLAGSFNGLQFTRDDDGNFKTAVGDDDKTVLMVKTYGSKVFVDIREWFSPKAARDGKQLPTKRGVMLSAADWRSICDRADEVRSEVVRLNERVAARQTSDLTRAPFAISDNVKIIVLPLAELPIEGCKWRKPASTPGVRILLEKRSVKQAAPSSSSCAMTTNTASIALTPLTWQLLFTANRTETDSIIAVAEKEASLAAKKREDDFVAEEKKMFKAFWDLPNLR